MTSALSLLASASDGQPATGVVYFDTENAFSAARFAFLLPKPAACTYFCIAWLKSLESAHLTSFPLAMTRLFSSSCSFF